MVHPNQSNETSTSTPSNQPQQIRQLVDNLTFSSKFDSGNLARVERCGANSYNLYASAESKDQMQCAWFYFSITTTVERRVSLHIRNLGGQAKLYNEHFHRPVFKEKDDKWKRVPAHEWVGCDKVVDGCSIHFGHQLPKGTTYFAFTYPYSYEEVQRTIKELEKAHSAILKCDLLCNSMLGRRVDVLTVGKKPFEGKPHVLLCARVHPGETPGQFMLFGMLNFLLSGIPQAQALRDSMVFKFVPMLNPDGVYLGKYRTNCNGEHEAIGPVKELAGSLPLVAFVDFHAHANKRGAFCYGNTMSDPQLLQCHGFMKKIASFSSYFDATACNFNASNVTFKDKRGGKEGETTEGSSRAQIHYANPHLIHSYTLEAHYSCDNRHRPMTPVQWEEIGRAVAKALAQMDFSKSTPAIVSNPGHLANAANASPKNANSASEDDKSKQLDKRKNSETERMAGAE